MYLNFPKSSSVRSCTCFSSFWSFFSSQFSCSAKFFQRFLKFFLLSVLSCLVQERLDFFLFCVHEWRLRVNVCPGSEQEKLLTFNVRILGCVFE
jgi:hypothetical protein